MDSKPRPNKTQIENTIMTSMLVLITQKIWWIKCWWRFFFVYSWLQSVLHQYVYHGIFTGVKHRL